MTRLKIKKFKSPLNQTQQTTLFGWGITTVVLSGISYFVIYTNTKHMGYSIIASIIAGLLFTMLIQHIHKTLLKNVKFLKPKPLLQLTLYTIFICVIIAGISVMFDLSLKYLIGLFA